MYKSCEALQKECELLFAIKQIKDRCYNHTNQNKSEV